MGVCAEKELSVTCFLTNLLVFYIVDGLKRDVFFLNNSFQRPQVTL